jgi:phenylpyruvate tautomerase
MPTLRIQTNAPEAADRAPELLAAASALVAAKLGKPERYVLVTLESNPHMRFAGSDAPLAYLELKSLGLPEERTADLSAALCGFLAEHLGIAADRIYIEFASPPRHLFGWNGGTF